MIKRTSEVQLAVFERINVGKGILDELDGQTHDGVGGRSQSLRDSCSPAELLIADRLTQRV